MDIAITISNRELTPAVVNFFQHENETVTLNFTLDSYLYGEVDLRNYKAYGVTIQNTLVDMTELEMNYDSADDKLRLSWLVQEYSLRQEGAITYQIVFKENADDGENTAVFYTYKGIMINRGSVDGDNHITANYPTILKQWLDNMQDIAGTVATALICIKYGETIPVSDRVAGRVYFQFTDSANTKGRFEDHEGKELNLSAYLPLSGGTVNGTITHNSASSEVFANKNTDDGRLLLLGGTKFANGGAIYVCGKDRSTSPGAVVLRTSDGTTNKEFISKPDGTLTWDGKNVVRSVNNTQANTSGDVTVDVGVTSVNGKKGALTPADTGCLPLTGGTMSGTLTLNKNHIKGASSIEFDVSSSANNGGFIDFHYNGSTEDFTSRIIEGSTGKVEITAPNGVSVNNKHVVRSINGVTADNAGNVALSVIKSSGSSGQVGLQQGDSTENGASLWLHGNDNSGEGVCRIQVYDKSAGTYRALDICPDGSLTWQGKNIITSAGGTVDGSFTMSGDILKNKNNTSFMSIFGGTNVNNGASLEMNGHSRDTNAGCFNLRARSSDGSAKSLFGKPDGTLSWAGNNIVTTTAISKASNGYVKFSNGIIIQWGKTSSNNNVTVTFPTAFTSTPAVTTGVVKASGDSYAPIITAISTTSFTIYAGGGARTDPSYWIAIGY